MTTMHAGFRANPLLRPVVTVPPRPTTTLNIADNPIARAAVDAAKGGPK